MKQRHISWKFARHEERSIALLSIYYKKEQEDASETYIRGLIDGYFMNIIPIPLEEDEA